MLRIIDLMSLTKNKKGSRRGRISYANLGINQMGAVYEALLSYRGFIAEQDLYEVKKAGDNFNELDVGYFVTAQELDQYTEEERVRYESGDKKGQLRKDSSVSTRRASLSIVWQAENVKSPPLTIRLSRLHSALLSMPSRSC